MTENEQFDQNDQQTQSDNKTGKFFSKAQILFTVIYLAVLALVYYITVPVINLRLGSSYIFIALIILPIIVNIMWYVKCKDISSSYTTRTKLVYDHVTRQFNKKTVLVKDKDKFLLCFRNYALIVISTTIALTALLSITGAPIFNAKRYATQLPVETSTIEELNEVFDYEDGEVLLPVIDKDVAFRIAQTKLGDYGSQYQIDFEHFTILSAERNGKTELIRVTPLEYINPFVAVSRMSKGTVGYIEVNVVTQESKLVTFNESDGLKYMPSALLNYDLDRHIRFHYPTEIYNKRYFEIDNEGNPYWVLPTVKKEIGAFSGNTPKGVIIVNPITGEINNYKLGEEPSWVQRSIDVSTVSKQANNNLTYPHGFFNTLFTKKDVFNLSDGYNYFLKGGNTYYVSCITSPNDSDQTSVGIITINLKTKETKRYSILGITEMRAREIAMYDERVKAQELDATWPIFVSYHGVPTYFLVLKNTNQVQKAVFIDAQTGKSVAMGDTIAAAKNEYDSLISGSGNIDKEDFTVNGTVTRIRDLGDTIEFMISGVEDKYFLVHTSLNLDARFLKVGDKVKVTYEEYKAYNFVKDIKVTE